jgi:hypothetical protein
MPAEFASASQGRVPSGSLRSGILARNAGVELLHLNFTYDRPKWYYKLCRSAIIARSSLQRSPTAAPLLIPKIPKTGEAYGIILPAAHAAVLDRFGG